LTDPGLRFLVLVSEAMRRDVLDLLPDFDTRKIRVIPPGVDPARFARVDRETGRDRLSREWGVPREGVRLVFAAGGDFEKRNVATLAQALLRLADRPDWHLVLVGAREGQVSWPGALRPRTSFLGRVADVGPVYAGCDLMVYPAWYDEFAMVVLEAMASGLPVILTRTVGAAEVLGERNRAQGVLSDPADAVALAARIARFLEDPGERRAMGEENRAAADRLRWTSIYRAYRALYDEVAAVDKA
jgi:UDP-glucose:(heptosyl)LPS alpha-1,3-glucosyltransferase